MRTERSLMKPMVRLVANIQGNEALGRELILQLARHLLSGYGDGRVRYSVINLSPMFVRAGPEDHQAVERDRHLRTALPEP